ncbi:MAG: hypothetical protein ACYC3I_13015 [Gemmataceae bacterium]
MNFPTITIVVPHTGEVYRMFVSGLMGIDKTTTPPIYLYDLPKGKSQLMVLRRQEEAHYSEPAALARVADSLADAAGSD